MPSSRALGVLLALAVACDGSTISRPDADLESGAADSPDVGSESPDAGSQTPDYGSQGSDSGSQSPDSGADATVDSGCLGGCARTAPTLAAGRCHACAIDRDDLWCWGAPLDGSVVGFESGVPPARVAGVEGRLAGVSVQNGGACVVVDGGTVSCWGAYRDVDDVLRYDGSPHPIEGVDDAVQVSGTRLRGCALERSGAVSCWGASHTSGTVLREAAPVPGISGALQVAVNGERQCALVEGGRLLCWEGAGSGTGRPAEVAGVHDVVSVGIGSAHTCALLSSGRVSCWGDRSRGQLGDGRDLPPRDEPGDVPGVEDATLLAVGSDHACVADRTGAVVCWGGWADWQHRWLEYSDPTIPLSPPPAAPVAIEGLDDATELAAGDYLTCARRASGGIVCWGSNCNGALGRVPVFSSETSVAVPGLDDVVDIGAGFDRMCAARGDGTLWCWGGGLPAPVAIPGIEDALEVEIGGTPPADPWGPSFELGEHACVRHATGRVSCWGHANHGQLGDGVVGGGRDLPATPVSGLEDAVAIRAGGVHTCALRETGAVVCWGGNHSGQIGGGDGLAAATPVEPRLPGRVVDLSAGPDDTLAVLEDGTPYVWGFVRYEGGDHPSHTPVPIELEVRDERWELVPLGRVRRLDSDLHGGSRCAIRPDGSVECWGRGPWYRGSSGDHEWAGSLLPTSISGPSAEVAELSLPYVRTTTGELFHCASGSGSASRVDAFRDVLEVAAGEGFVCARHADGTVSCAGSNHFGQLGDGRGLPSSTVPLEVELR